jgi:hypothetical protein
MRFVVPTRLLFSLVCAVLTLAPAPAGTLDVRFFYSPPGSVEPTYHTAIWIEDGTGKIVRTLFVSQELSDAAYKVGNVCPDWVKQAHWEAAPKNDVAAVTAPTPNVGVGELSFDLAKLDLAPGTYGFRFQVHITDDYNVLYRGSFTLGGPDADVKLETLVGPGKMASTEQFVRDVEVRYRGGKE